jgi:hypothetical protein
MALKEGQAMCLLARIVQGDLVLPVGTIVRVVHAWNGGVAVDVHGYFGMRLIVENEQLAPVDSLGPTVERDGTGQFL